MCIRDSDTPARLQESLASYHSALIGLTGSLQQLEPVYKAYGQKPSVLELSLNGNPIVSHSSYFFLMGPDGKLQTFFPPILSPETMAALIKKYLPSWMAAHRLLCEPATALEVLAQYPPYTSQIWNLSVRFPTIYPCIIWEHSIPSIAWLISPSKYS